MAVPTDIRVEDLKAWARIRFDEMLRGERLTSQFQRWADGELGRDYMFKIEMVLNDEVAGFVREASNRPKIDAAKDR
ncbi:MAG TPA: hypothetical protein VMZ50_06205 [Phycisphaerae bacterium]|nr:hypothetical protein [Phycisphaerae bacterium]